MMESLDKNNLSSGYLLDVCCQLMAKKMNNKPIEQWRAADYNRLNSQLGKQTKIYLSENTLKRIFGRLKTPQRYYPQKATRDALAQFVGYRDWQEFELVTLSEMRQETDKETPFITSEPLVPKKEKKKRKYNFFYIGAVLFITLLGILFCFTKPKVAPFGIKLVCENSYGDIPHTAFFKLKDSSGKFADYEFDVDFKGDAYKKRIKMGQKFTTFFKNPGVVYATLFYGQRPIDTTLIIVQTKGWMVTSKNDSAQLFSVNNLKPLNPNYMAVSTKQLDSAGVNLSHRFQIDYNNIKKSTINGDNFDFSCRVLAEQTRPGSQCIETKVLIFGEKDFHYIKLYRQNCVAFSAYKFSENNVLGSDEFLGNLAFNPENGGDIKLKIQNKEVNLFLNNKLVLKTNYTRSIGKIMGVKIIFGGIGEVITPKLSDLQSGELF